MAWNKMANVENPDNRNPKTMNLRGTQGAHENRKKVSEKVSPPNMVESDSPLVLVYWDNDSRQLTRPIQLSP